MPSDATTYLQDILNRLGQGDAGARDELIARSCRRLELLTRKIFRNFPRARQFDETSDILQEALLRLSRRLENLTQSDRLPATMAEFFNLAAREIRHALLDLIRRHFGPEGAGTHEVPMPANPEDSRTTPTIAALDNSHDPAQLALWNDFHRQAEMLPCEEQEVFNLRFYQGFSLAEVSDALGISQASAHRRWLKARLLLQHALDGLL